MEEIPLPHNDLMERAVLGAMLAGHSQSVELLDTLKPDDFFNSWHRKLVDTILRLYAAGDSPKLHAVYEKWRG